MSAPVLWVACAVVVLMLFCACATGGRARWKRKTKRPWPLVPTTWDLPAQTKATVIPPGTIEAGG